MKYRHTKEIRIELDGNAPLLGYPMDWMIQKGHGEEMGEILMGMLVDGIDTFSGPCGTGWIKIHIQSRTNSDTIVKPD